MMAKPSANISEWLTVDIGAANEMVYVDCDQGPLQYFQDGTVRYPLGLQHQGSVRQQKGAVAQTGSKVWCDMTPTEKNVIIVTTARKNQKLREWKGESFWKDALQREGLLKGGFGEVFAERPRDEVVNVDTTGWFSKRTDKKDSS
eukprot:gnl/TRDRNA2_/TRDRNA2_47563_c0_seq1.p1 gnl/TRDRNA2_/TRDRNA2_47563_c0~~gnl/TRDRNA2_/TRDRNA2_47563_c0_seq1.p1  ORF type:complete len:145 (+),score=29.45 gnl/TRDRNA2_/TRDRNA2_47563_c0_seq1:30-464(+)